MDDDEAERRGGRLAPRASGPADSDALWGPFPAFWRSFPAFWRSFPALRRSPPAGKNRVFEAAGAVGRAAGRDGAEIRVKLAPVADPVPTDPKALTFVALDTRTPYTLDFDAADGGKNAHYMLRWVNSKGEKGPWSETATATVGV